MQYVILFQFLQQFGSSSKAWQLLQTTPYFLSHFHSASCNITIAPHWLQIFAVRASCVTTTHLISYTAVCILSNTGVLQIRAIYRWGPLSRPLSVKSPYLQKFLLPTVCDNCEFLRRKSDEQSCRFSIQFARITRNRPIAVSGVCATVMLLIITHNMWILQIRAC